MASEHSVAAYEAHALGGEATLTTIEMFALRAGRGIQAAG